MRLTLAIIALCTIFYSGCAPRNSEFCYNTATSTYIKCPANAQPGDVVDVKPRKRSK